MRHSGKLGSKAVVLLAVGIILDQLTKYWASLSLSMTQATPIVSPVLEFVLVHNYGAAYGILQGQRALLLAITVIIIFLAYRYAYMIIRSVYSEYALAFIGIGALGNFIDRLRLGYVVDFINIHIFPVFNIADICIDIGILLLVIELFKVPNDRAD